MVLSSVGRVGNFSPSSPVAYNGGKVKSLSSRRNTPFVGDYLVRMDRGYAVQIRTVSSCPDAADKEQLVVQMGETMVQAFND